MVRFNNQHILWYTRIHGTRSTFVAKYLVNGDAEFSSDLAGAALRSCR